MTIRDLEEELVQALDQAFDTWDGQESEPRFVAQQIMPLVNQRTAEALREAATAMRTCGDHHPSCLRCQDADALWKRANQIENEGADR